MHREARLIQRDARDGDILRARGTFLELQFQQPRRIRLRGFLRAILPARRLRRMHGEQCAPDITAHFPGSRLELQPRDAHFRRCLRFARIALAARLDRDVESRLDDPRRNSARAAVVAGLERQHGIGPLARRLQCALRRLHARAEHGEIGIFLHRLGGQPWERPARVLCGKSARVEVHRRACGRERLPDKARATSKRGGCDEQDKRWVAGHFPEVAGDGEVKSVGFYHGRRERPPRMTMAMGPSISRPAIFIVWSAAYFFKHPAVVAEFCPCLSREFHRRWR